MVNSQYLDFTWASNKGKTAVFYVRSKSSDSLLATIQWYGPWRQYCFYPAANTIWNPGCLNDVCAFIKEKMEERRHATSENQG